MVVVPIGLYGDFSLAVKSRLNDGSLKQSETLRFPHMWFFLCEEKNMSFESLTCHAVSRGMGDRGLNYLLALFGIE